MKTSSLRWFSLASAIALLGAGCSSVSPFARLSSGVPSTTVVQKMGFGKLPKLADVGVQGSAPTVPSSVPSGAEATAPPSKDARVSNGSGVASSGVGIASPGMMPIRPTPYPYPQPRPVSVEYVIEASLPTWVSEDDVLRDRKTVPEASALRSIGTSFGLPTPLMTGMDRFSSFDAQWTDKDAYTWTLSGQSSQLSLFSSGPAERVVFGQTTLKNDEALRLSFEFLHAHGITEYQQSAGIVDDSPSIYPMMKGGVETNIAPCPMMEGTNGDAAGGGTVSSYPYPCGGWSQQLTVYYPLVRDGRSVVDASGNIVRGASLTFDATTKRVTSGQITLPIASDRSRYPLIDVESAKRRLQAGGRNPVWAYDEAGGSIKVRLTKIELTWMQENVWSGTENQSYLIPALLATGTVEHSKTIGREDYRTVLPLLADDVFEDVPVDGTTPVPVPVPMMGAPSIAPTILKP